LQGALGTLNDFEVHRRLAATVAHRGKRSREQSEKALAMGFITGQEQQQATCYIAAVKKTGARLSKTPKFLEIANVPTGASSHVSARKLWTLLFCWILAELRWIVFYP
jgi:hypothetical protein